MHRLKSLAPILLLVLAAVIWFTFVSESLSKWFTRLTSRSEYNGQLIGKVVRAEGTVRVLHLSDIKFVSSPTEKPVELRDGDQVQTSVDSKAIFVLNSEDEFVLGSGGLVQFQLWNPKDPNSPVYIRIQLGQLTLNKAGVKGHAYVVKDGRLYLPNQKPIDRPMALTVLRNAPLDMNLADAQASGTAQDTSASGAAGAEFDDASSPLPASGADPETLSNEYIDDTIASRQGQLQKCWLSRLKDSPKLKGHMVLQFEITRRGRVKDVRITDATLDDEVLSKCVVSVISRISFRQYKGPEISLSYPITFE
jgi:hypothetical protein